MAKSPQKQQRGARNASKNEALWLYGKHACRAALSNPRRDIRQILVTRNTAQELSDVLKNRHFEDNSPQDIASRLPRDAVHQGIAIEATPLPTILLQEWLTAPHEGPLLLLDQITDPHNVGAILRSAAAFGASAVLMQDRHSPPESGVLAKSASGALEVVPMLRVTNLTQAMAATREAGYWCIGLDGHAEQIISHAQLPQKIALVLGAEGKGLRRLVAGHCDLTVRLPISDKVESLNVSNAAAVALYALTQM